VNIVINGCLPFDLSDEWVEDGEDIICEAVCDVFDRQCIWLSVGKKRIVRHVIEPIPPGGGRSIG